MELSLNQHKYLRHSGANIYRKNRVTQVNKQARKTRSLSLAQKTQNREEK